MAEKSAKDRFNETADDPFNSDESQETVHVVLAGCIKAGKSTLANALLGLKETEHGTMEPEHGTMEPEHGTMEPVTKEVTKNGVTLKVTDTVGLEEQEGKKVLKKLSKHVKCNANLLVYCLSVSPNSRFAPSNPAAMKSLQEAYGKGIWDHCIVALTFSNIALDRLRRRYSKEEATTKYRAHLLQYMALFHQELERLGVRNKKMKLFAGYQRSPEDQHTVQAIYAGSGEVINEIDYVANMEAIPTGDAPDDVVMAIIDPVETLTKNWDECLYTEMVKRCSATDQKGKLLQYHYGLLTVICMAGAGGLLVGAGVGAVVGAVAWFVGMGVGAVLGGIAGGVMGVMGGATTGDFFWNNNFL